MDAWLNFLLNGLGSLGDWRLLIAGVGMFCETSILIGLLIPGDTIVLLTATSVRGPLEFALLFLAVVVGSLLGESVGFLLGHRFGPQLRASRLGRMIGERNWVRAEAYLDRRGGIAVFVSRYLPVLHALIPVTVGTSAMTYRRFLSWTAPACVLWTAIYVSLGTAAGSSYRALESTLHFAGWIFFGVIVVGLGLAYLIRRFAQRHAAVADADLAKNDGGTP
jgi:membrane-associated protein